MKQVFMQASEAHWQMAAMEGKDWVLSQAENNFEKNTALQTYKGEINSLEVAEVFSEVRSIKTIIQTLLKPHIGSMCNSDYSN